MIITVHNAKRVTFDGRDCFIVSLLDDKGQLLFDPKEGRYDPEATSEHPTREEAVTRARELAQRRGAKTIGLIRDDGRLERVSLLAP